MSGGNLAQQVVAAGLRARRFFLRTEQAAGT